MIFSLITGGDVRAWPLSDKAYMIISSKTKKALQVYNASKSNLANIEVAKPHGGVNQRWILFSKPSKDKNRHYIITSLKSSKVLDISGYSKKNKANIQQFKYYGTNNQLWNLIKISHELYKIVSVHSNKCLEADDLSHKDILNVYQADCGLTENQLWSFREISAKSEQIYKIISKKSKKVLDVDSKSLDNGTNIQQFKSHNGDNQLWTLWPDGFDNGIQVYSIISFLSGKALDLDGYSMKNGANIQQFKYHGGDNQRWKLMPVGDYYKIVCVHSNKCLDVSSFGSEDGANVRQYECNQSENQLWQLLGKKLKHIDIIGNSK